MRYCFECRLKLNGITKQKTKTLNCKTELTVKTKTINDSFSNKMEVVKTLFKPLCLKCFKLYKA